MSNEMKNDNFLDLAEITYLTAENSRFYRTKNGFPALEAVLPKFGDDLEANDDKTPVKQDLGRVFFHRCFPFETPDEYISVLNKDGREYAMIRDLNEMPAEAQEIIRNELERKYLCPTVTKIKSLKEKLGYSFWEVETDKGEMLFSMHDTYRNIARVGDGMLIITDVDGNRYRIDDVSKLDRKSFKRIELYL
ncbi:MAG: DUF1854 domain-containing protein [Clostridia bacterium]|nr:DUF1854 domain-containing protein [Clostridia bacterium]